MENQLKTPPDAISFAVKGIKDMYGFFEQMENALKNGSQTELERNLLCAKINFALLLQKPIELLAKEYGVESY